MTYEEFNKNVKMNYVAHIALKNEFVSIYKSDDSRFGMHVIVRRLDEQRIGKERIHWFIGNKRYCNKGRFELALKSIKL